jgi:hypothetical protein
VGELLRVGADLVSKEAGKHVVDPLLGSVTAARRRLESLYLQEEIPSPLTATGA